MRMFIVIAAALSALFITALPSVAVARDRDCADFNTQRAAQLFFIRHGGPRYDPDRLDGDDDGIACEDNPCPCYYGKRLPKSAGLALESLGDVLQRFEGGQAHRHRDRRLA